jgi:hypothetical protein
MSLVGFSESLVVESFTKSREYSLAVLVTGLSPVVERRR